jgi:U3 small nucleolar RNA-associated protein 4
MVLTTGHQLVEFHVLTGKLSDWSRRNPKAYLPAAFTVIKDRAMGAIWDVSQDRERLWLYGPSWMWMFDLSQDFPSEDAGDATEAAMPESQVIKREPSSFKKRKRGNNEDNWKSLNSGAGDRMPFSQSAIRLGRKMRKTTGNNESTAEWILLDKERKQDDQADKDGNHEHYDEVAAASDSNLARLRREQLRDSSASDDDDVEADSKGEIKSNKQPRRLTEGANVFASSGKGGVAFAVVIENKTNGEAKREDGRHKPNSKDETQALQLADPKLEPTPRHRWWHTHRYREVLGIVPLGPSFGHDRRADDSLEVVVVERPIWDVELPGRYVRDYE